jgi:hypothetical protein
MPDAPLQFLKSSVSVMLLSLLLAGGSVGFAYGQEADSGGTASAGADSGDGTSSADSDSSATASAGPDGSGGVTADSHGETSGSATGGDTSATQPGISADASATSGDTPTATTSTSAGTSATSTAGNYKSAYADTDDGTVYQKLGKNRGYAVAYEDGAYSAAYYRGDTASAFSGIYADENFTKKDARSIIRSQVKVGAYANRTEAGAWASAGTYAEGRVGSWASSAGTKAEAGAWANGSSSAAFANTRSSASFGNTRKKSKQLRLAKEINDCGSNVRRSDRIRCSRP